MVLHIGCRNGVEQLFRTIDFGLLDYGQIRGTQQSSNHIEEFTPKTKLALVNINWGSTFDSATDGTIKVMLSHQVVTKKLS